MDAPTRRIVINLALAVLLWATAAATQDRHVPVRTEPVATDVEVNLAGSAGKLSEIKTALLG